MCKEKISFLIKISNKSALLLTFIALFFLSCVKEETKIDTDIEKSINRLDNYTDWSIYRGDKKGNQYSELAQIHAANVHKLELVWQYKTGDATKNTIAVALDIELKELFNY